MEKLRYPYEPGKAGIPFEEIFQYSKNGRENGIIVGGSGRKIKFEIKESFLEVCDPEFPDRIMGASVKRHGVATFKLQTKVSELDEYLEFPWEKHPDMFAKYFVPVALEHFKNMGIEVNICRGIWSRGSDNYATYVDELKRSRDQVKAAKNTWSGKRFAECGFSEICERDIRYNTLEDDPIQADFHRTLNPRT
jgi:hypothetical protein